MIPLTTSQVLLEVTVPGAQSTLQDFKLPESGGGYTYDESNSWLSPTSNRFIVWKINKDTIEFKEISMDIELEGNELNLRLQNIPILNGVGIHETPTDVVILFATVGSVHRIFLPHPKKLHRISPNPTARSRQSIFANFSEAAITNPDNFYVWNNHLGSGAGSVALSSLVTNCSWLKDGDAFFVLANNSGSLVQVKISSKGEKSMIGELRQCSLIGKLRGFVPSIIRSNQEDDSIVSLVSHQINRDTLMFALSRDLKIRIWSYQKQKCLLSHTLLSPNQLELIGSCARRPFLRKCLSGDDLLLSVFICTMDQKQFMVYKLMKETASQIISLKEVATINLNLEDDLIDFKVIGHEIWCLCLDPQKKPILKRSSFQCSDGWQSLLLHSDIEPSRTSSQLWHRDEEYIKNTFHRGKFSLQSISLALSEFVDCAVDEFAVLTFDGLMTKVLDLIRNESVTTGTIMKSDDHHHNQEERKRKESWEKFYSLCLKYQSMATKPLALILDPKTGLVSLVTKSIVSFIPRHDLINQVIISSEKDLSSISEDPQITSSLQTVLDMVSIINRSLPPEAIHLFESSMASGMLASEIGQIILEKYLKEYVITLPDKSTEPLKNAFANIHSKTPLLIEAIDALVKVLGLDSIENLDISLDTEQTSSNYLDAFFTSSTGNTLVAQNLKVFAMIRFNFCRDLLLFQQFVLNFRNTLGFSSKSNEKMRAMSLQNTAHHVHSYYFLTWVSESILGTDIQNKILSPELTEAQLNVLGLLDYVGINRRTRSNEPRCDLLTAFIERKAGVLAKKILADKLQTSDSMMVHQVWKEVLPQYTVCVSQLLWPMSNSFLLPEFLLGHNQLQLLEKYVQLSDPWIQYSTASREFLVGYIKLCRGQTAESIDHFTAASSGVGQELFFQKLTQISIDTIEDQSMGSMIFHYFKKVIQLVTNVSDSESVIRIANHAIAQLNEEFDDEHEEHLSQLYTTLFLNYLDVGKYDEAYQVMILNPDSSTRNDRLRQFIVKLFEKNSAKKLISYSFDGFSEDFIHIIEQRARSNDLSSLSSSCGYYEVLFSFHTKEGRHRRAASTMYEFSRRLGQEVPGIESLRKQVSCFLITLNCLRLVDKKFQWIAKPTLTQKSNLNITINEAAPSPKRPFDLDRPIKSSKKEIQVLGIEDIKIEYELSNCRLKLLERNPRLNDLATSHIGPSEVVTLLLSNSMYETVLKLCRILNLPVIPVFESLVSKYIRLVQLPSMDQDLDESMKEIYECFGDEMVAPQDFIMTSDCPPATKVWHLVQSYLEIHEESKSSKLHKCITEKLLASGVALPTSLKQSYQARNCPQYLWLLMSYNYVEEASILAIEYLDAILGRGIEYFDILTPLAPNSGPVYIPHNHFQNLLAILSEEENSCHSQYQKKLFDKIQEVQETSLRYSDAFIRSSTTV